jgi:hypothetical protein
MTDFGAIVDAVRTTGALHYSRSSVPTEFVAWRRRLRQAAQVAGLSIRVVRTTDYVVVESRDYEISEDEEGATADVIGGFMVGHRVTYDDALYARRRQRMSVVRPTVGPSDQTD